MKAQQTVRLTIAHKTEQIPPRTVTVSFGGTAIDGLQATVKKLYPNHIFWGVERL
jgi:hypothetical protein